MERRMLRLAASLAAVVFAAACAQNPESPTSPSASARLDGRESRWLDLEGDGARRR